MGLGLPLASPMALTLSITAQTRAVPTRKPRCYLVYALAPEGLSAARANAALNALTADPALPLALWHDHFIGEAGGCILFYVTCQAEQKVLFENEYLLGWQVDYRPLVFSFSPSAFDAQTAFTLKRYRATDWQELRTKERPNYGAREVGQEAETGKEV